MARKQANKRKQPQKAEVQVSSEEEDKNSGADSSSEEPEDLLQTLTIDENGDASDSENEVEEDSDDDDALSMSADEDGNYVTNGNEDSNDDEDGSEADEDDSEKESDGDEEGDDSLIDNDSDESLEFESESEEEEIETVQENKNGEDNDNVEKTKSTIEGSSKKSKKKGRKVLRNAGQSLVQELNAGKVVDEYENDTSDEEDIRNTVGNIPMQWYDEYKHIGYDWDAKKIIKPPKRDQLDDFLKRMEDPDFWRTVKDPQTGQDIVLSEEDIDLIKRINSRRIPDQQFDEYAPWIEWFTSEVEQQPIRNIPEHKRSFLPSRSEKKAVSKLVHALKQGWIKSTEELENEKKKKSGPKFYMLWETDTERERMRRIHDHVAAPKRDLPGHAESYNPPAEYLFDEKELQEWNRSKADPSKRKLHYVPQKYTSLRSVPAYSRFYKERFLRCLDLYLCPRARRMKLNIDAEYLIPKLPSAKDLQPFPTVESVVYKGHTDMIRSISVEPMGEYMVSGSDDTTVKIWEIVTGRCIRTIETGEIIRSVSWCPNAKISLIAVATGSRLLLINPKVGDKLLVQRTDEILKEVPKHDTVESERIKTAVQWSVAEGDEYEKQGVRVIITHFKPITQVTWHGRGDYFSTVMPEGANRSTLIHQLSKRRTQVPFSKSKGLIQCVLFHPVKPCLFVATQKNVRIYDLVKQELVKKLITNCKWISSMAIHPKGDNLLVATYDKKMLWFDLDLSTKPYQTLRLHKNAVRGVAFHLRYPLFASSSDDLSVIVSHGMVYNDLLQNPLIVPLKKLTTHVPTNDFGVFDLMWHPTQPWIFSSGADATVRLYT